MPETDVTWVKKFLSYEQNGTKITFSIFRLITQDLIGATKVQLKFNYNFWAPPNVFCKLSIYQSYVIFKKNINFSTKWAIHIILKNKT